MINALQEKNFMEINRAFSCINIGSGCEKLGKQKNVFKVFVQYFTLNHNIPSGFSPYLLDQKRLNLVQIHIELNFWHMLHVT